MKIEVTSGERHLPCAAVDVSGDSLTGSGPSGSFLLRLLWRLCRWCVGSVRTVRLWHGPWFVWKGRLGTDILHCYGLMVLFVFGACGIFFVSHVYLAFMRLFFLFEYHAFFDVEEHDGITRRDCRMLSKQLNSRVLLVHLDFNLM